MGDDSGREEQGCCGANELSRPGASLLIDRLARTIVFDLPSLEITPYGRERLGHLMLSTHPPLHHSIPPALQHSIPDTPASYCTNLLTARRTKLDQLCSMGIDFGTVRCDAQVLPGAAPARLAVSIRASKQS